MLLDPMGGIVITNDGNCILREVREDVYLLPRISDHARSWLAARTCTRGGTLTSLVESVPLKIEQKRVGTTSLHRHPGELMHFFVGMYKLVGRHINRRCSTTSDQCLCA